MYHFLDISYKFQFRLSHQQFTCKELQVFFLFKNVYKSNCNDLKLWGVKILKIQIFSGKKKLLLYDRTDKTIIIWSSAHLHAWGNGQSLASTLNPWLSDWSLPRSEIPGFNTGLKSGLHSGQSAWSGSGSRILPGQDAKWYKNLSIRMDRWMDNNESKNEVHKDTKCTSNKPF